MEYKVLPINEVKLDINNPRIKQWLEIYNEDEITSEGIALALSASSGTSNTSSYSALKESIRVHKGLINPIIVNKYPDGNLVVIEGNTRLQIYKEFAAADPDGPWNSIIAIVYDNLPEEEIHAIRLQTHLVGPRDWDPFSKAKYLNQLYNGDKMPMSMITSYCGGKQSEVTKLVNAYNDMISTYFPVAEEMGMDPDPRDFSKFAELQNSSIREALLAHHYEKKDFAKWVINKNIDNAQNVRQLPKVLSNSAARDVFLKKNISEAIKVIHVNDKGGASLSSASLDELVVTLVQKIRNIGFNDVKMLRDNPDYADKKNNIYELLFEINELSEEIKGEE